PFALDKGLAVWPLVVLVLILPIIAAIITLVMKPNPGSRADVRRRGKEAGYRAAIATSADAPERIGLEKTGVADEIRRLADLRDDGLITSDEFERRKRKLLET